MSTTPVKRNEVRGQLGALAPVIFALFNILSDRCDVSTYNTATWKKQLRIIGLFARRWAQASVVAWRIMQKQDIGVLRDCYATQASFTTWLLEDFPTRSTAMLAGAPFDVQTHMWHTYMSTDTPVIIEDNDWLRAAAITRKIERDSVDLQLTPTEVIANYDLSFSP